MKKIIKLFLNITILFTILLVSCSSSSYVEEASESGSNSSNTETTNQVVISSDRKIIYTVTYDFNVSNINETIGKVNDEVTLVSGYISNSSQSDNSYAYYRYKIPTDKLNEFLDYVDSLGGSTSKNISTQDVTSSYNELEAKIEVLTASKNAYLKILNENTLTTSEIIEINDKIDDLNYQIKEATLELDSLQGSLDYSTVIIYYNEIAENNGTQEFWSNYGLFLLSVLKIIGSIILYTIPFAGVAGIVLLVIFIVKKKKVNKNNS